MAKYIDLTGAQNLVSNIKVLINEGDASSFKFAKFDEDTRELSLYKTSTPDEGANGDFVVTIPETDVSELMKKLSTTNVGNIVVTKADGTIEDGGVLVTNIATKTEIQVVDEKIGTVSDLETTNKANLVVAINEVRNSVSAGGTEAAITITSETTTEGMLKSYTIKQGSNTVGVIDIPKDLVVSSGTIEVNPDGKENGTYIKLVISNQQEPLYINVGTLVDLYTPQSNASQIQLTIDNSTREVSAVIVDGSVDSDALASNSVTTVKIADSNVTYAKLASDVLVAFDTAGSAATAQTNAQKYADDLNTAMTTKVDEIDEKLTELESTIPEIETITSDEINALFE